MVSFYYKEEKASLFINFPHSGSDISSCSNLDCSSQGPSVSLSCATEITLIPIFLRKEHWKWAFSLPVSATVSIFFIFTPSNLWAKQNFV